MMLMEVFVPMHALTEDGRQHLAERLLAAMTVHEGTPPEILEALRGLWHVVVHEPEAWATGGRAAGAAGPPPYFVRVSVPSDGSSMTDEVRADYVATIMRVLAEADEDPQRFYREPCVSVHIVDVPEGSFGTLGRAMRNADMIKLVMGDDAGGDLEAAVPVQPGATTATDPVCGMTVALTDTAITLSHDGATYAFCNTGCRDVFREQLAGAAR